MDPTIDTIVSRATPPGRGGVGIVRLSGPQAYGIALNLTRQKELKPRYAHYGPFYEDCLIVDTGLCLYFPGPASYTGETVVELQGHGGPIILDRIIKSALRLGARMAGPGEFTHRAFLNGKIDLAQAEAIADLIDASTSRAAMAAHQSLSGIFSKRVKAIEHQLIELRMYVEAAIDFVEEEIDFLASSAVSDRFVKIERLFNTLVKETQQGVTLQEGKTLAIIGEPNAGKSSLLNLWAGEEASIVTDVPGTTRDMVIRQVMLDGVAIHLLDTAGLRETENNIEQEGIRRACQSIENADWVLWIQDASEKNVAPIVLRALKGAELKTLKVFNKIDLSGHGAGIQKDCAYLCAKTGEGFDEFLDWLKVKFEVEVQEGAFIARRRHLDALNRCETHLVQAKCFIESLTGELLAEELRLAALALQEITGVYTSDDLLGKIFSNFCIGK